MPLILQRTSAEGKIEGILAYSLSSAANLS